MTYDFVVIGGGCYGDFYVGQLLEARARHKLDWSRVAVLDRDPQCKVAGRRADDVDIIETDWVSFGPRVFDQPDVWLEGHLVPAPIAPHILFEWILSSLRCATRAGWTGDVPTQLPFAQVTDAGSLVLSWAPGLCPTHCIEPRICPLTSAPRTWDMPDTANSLADAGGLSHVETFTCRHHAYGVGTIPLGGLSAARERVQAAVGARVGVATVSGCHGLLDVVAID